MGAGVVGGVVVCPSGGGVPPGSAPKITLSMKLYEEIDATVKQTVEKVAWL